MADKRAEQGRARRAQGALERDALGFRLSRAQRRYLNRLRRNPGWRGIGGRQPQTRQALIRREILTPDGDRDVMNVAFDGRVWRWK